MYRIVLKSRACKQLRKLQWKDQKRIASAINELTHDPFIGKKLEGELTGLWSLRVWPYRIVYIIQKNIVTVTIVAIGDRKDVYKNLKK